VNETFPQGCNRYIMLGECSRNKWSQSILRYCVDSEKCLPGEAFVWVHSQLVHTCFLATKITISCVVSLEPLKKGEAKEFCFWEAFSKTALAAPALLPKFCLPQSRRFPGPQLQGQQWWENKGHPGSRPFVTAQSMCGGRCGVVSLAVSPVRELSPLPRGHLCKA